MRKLAAVSPVDLILRSAAVLDSTVLRSNRRGERPPFSIGRFDCPQMPVDLRVYLRTNSL